MTFEEVIIKQKKLAEKISEIDFSEFSCQQAHAYLTGRLWSQGAAKDVNDTLLPIYSEGYKQLYRKTTDTWDLHVTGDLIRSISLVNTPSKNSCALVIKPIQNGKYNTQEYSKTLEERSGQTIFQLSKKEHEQVVSDTIQEIGRQLKEIIKTV
jgi:hypothetical protein